MMRSLWTAASGMTGQQFNINTISNNLSNVNTVGYKKQRADFEDLLYETLKVAGTPSANESVVPIGVQAGHGVKVAGTQRIYTQGNYKETGNISDITITGEGFFKIRMYDGSAAYTRDGAFIIDSNGQFVNSSGYFMDPPIVLPEGFISESVAISEQGYVTCRLPGSDIPIEAGQIELYRFVNPKGLKSIGGNLLKETVASGPEIAGIPGYDGVGQTLHKFLEMSNVNIVDEMVDMIVAQRAYELNSKAVTTSDNMLGIAANLKR